MTAEPYHSERPFVYECVECQSRLEPENVSGFDSGDELIECPECGGELWNLRTPSGE